MVTPHATRTPRPRRGFTLIEVLTSILILGVLIGLLFVAFRTTRRYVSSVNDRAAASAVKMGVARFVEECGILPPLVRDQHPVASRRATVVPGPTPSFAVYDFAPVSGGGGVNPDLTVLRPTSLPAPSAPNPFLDPRYSERTLPVYLAGACDYPPPTGGASRVVPIDGIVGVGMYKARSDGTFQTPSSRTPAGRTTVGELEPLIDLSKGYLTLHQVVAAGAADQPVVELRDKKQVAVRFYRWLNDDPAGNAANTPYQHFRLPPLVGRQGSRYPSTPPDRDLETNTELRSATWAIVMAGPDGAFGDEPIDVLGARLGVTIAVDDQIRFRVNAEKDNIVEVGR